MQRKSLGLLFWFFSCLLAACAGKGNGVTATPTLAPTPIAVEKPTYVVQRGEVVRTIQLNGRVTPSQQQDLFFRQDGFVKEVMVAVGQEVTAGQVLVRLDDPERYQVDVAAAELAYAQARRELENVQLNSPVRLAEARLALEGAEKDLAEAQATRQQLDGARQIDSLTLEKLRGQAAASEKTLAAAQARYNQLANRPESNPERIAALDALLAARRAHSLATLNLNWAEGKVSQAEIDEAQLILDLAQAQYDKAAAEVRRWQEDSLTGEVSLARLALADAEARRALARRAQEAVELQAPFTGQVLSLGVAPGSQVKAFQAVLTLADPTQLEIRAVPTVEDLNLLGIGQETFVRLSSHQGEQFPASITLMPLVTHTVIQDARQDASVHFTLLDDSIPLTLGEAATILVTIDARQDALWLPPAAIRSFQGQDFVYVESGGVQRRVNVTLGLASAERVEILSGLEEGQKVIGQ